MNQNTDTCDSFVYLSYEGFILLYSVGLSDVMCSVKMEQLNGDQHTMLTLRSEHNKLQNKQFRLLMG